MEPPQGWCYLYFVPVRIFSVPKLHRRCHGVCFCVLCTTTPSESWDQITEYFLVHKGHYRVADLYDPSPNSWYHYFYGINPRAYAAYIAGILINVVGFAGASE